MMPGRGLFWIASIERQALKKADGADGDCTRFHPSLESLATKAEHRGLDCSRHCARTFVRRGRGLVYVTYVVEMTGFDDFRNNKSSTVTRFEWALGFQPAYDCQRF